MSLPNCSQSVASKNLCIHLDFCHIKKKKLSWTIPAKVLNALKENVQSKKKFCCCCCERDRMALSRTGEKFTTLTDFRNITSRLC